MNVWGQISNEALRTLFCLFKDCNSKKITKTIITEEIVLGHNITSMVENLPTELFLPPTRTLPLPSRTTAIIESPFAETMADFSSFFPSIDWFLVASLLLLVCLFMIRIVGLKSVLARLNLRQFMVGPLLEFVQEWIDEPDSKDATRRSPQPGFDFFLGMIFFYVATNRQNLDVRDDLSVPWSVLQLSVITFLPDPLLIMM